MIIPLVFPYSSAHLPQCTLGRICSNTSCTSCSWGEWVSLHHPLWTLQRGCSSRALWCALLLGCCRQYAPSTGICWYLGREHFWKMQLGLKNCTVGGVSSQPSKNDQDIVNVQLFHDLVSLVFSWSHCLTNPTICESWKKRFRIISLSAPNLDMWVLFQVLLSTMMVRFAIAVIW